jgi:hypothetical protein
MLAPVAATGVTTTLSCDRIAPDNPIEFASGNEIDGDVLQDLDGMVNFPSALAIQEPTSLGVTTWPATGDLSVRWTSAGATSALVTITPRAGTGSRIVCNPHTNGSLTIDAMLIDRSGLRTQDALVRIASYRDVTTTAESGKTYRLAAGLADSVLMQGR